VEFYDGVTNNSLLIICEFLRFWYVCCSSIGQKILILEKCLSFKMRKNVCFKTSINSYKKLNAMVLFTVMFIR
jgi:hypothetical protein